ncbi:MAG: formyl transferase [Gammaproteobacteria bacterium]
MSELSVVILCGKSPRHLYVANRLCGAARPLAIVHESGGRWDAAKLRRVLKPAVLWSKGWRWLRDRRRYRGDQEARFFFGDRAPRLQRPELVHDVPHINDPQVADLVARLQPDVVAVFGTTLIRAPLLGMGRLGMINLHGGLSPHYRGADCTFWALHNGEPDQVGCTLHFIDEGIDTGGLIAHVSPAVAAGDDELTLFWRAVKDSAEAYAELFERLEHGERLGCAQPERGRLYRVKDRQWKHERALARRMRDGMLEGVSLPPRSRWFSS